MKWMVFLFCVSLYSAWAEESGLPLHGFADAGGGFSKDAPANQKINGFKIGTIDFYLNPEFDDKVKALMEIAFEPSHADGAIGVDVERLQVGYTLTDSMTLWAGRFHTPYGTWNNAYHHGAQLQTSVYRPKFIDFEDGGGILPAHSVGIWSKGAISLNEDKIKYNLYVANGSKIVDGVLDMNNYRNDKNNYMVGGTVSYFGRNGFLDGLEIGAHGFFTKVNSYTTNTNTNSLDYQSTSDVNMFGGFLNYYAHGLEIIGEYYGFSNKNSSVAQSKRVSSNAQFIQLGYTFQDWITPYTRFEKTAFNSNDLYFSNQDGGSSYTRCSFGLRKDINPKAAFKIEYLMTTKDGSKPKYDIVQYDYAIRF